MYARALHGAVAFESAFQLTHPRGVRPLAAVASAQIALFQLTHPGGVRQAADAERRARDPQGAPARVERRMMAEDAAYRLCRRASASALCLPKEAAR